MLTADQFRALALAQPGAVESEHMGHPDFRANGRVFASLEPGGARGMVKLTPQQQQRALRTPCFLAANGAWGRSGCTMVTLADAERDVVAAALTDAWQVAMAAPPPRISAAARRRKPGRRG